MHGLTSFGQLARIGGLLAAIWTVALGGPGCDADEMNDEPEDPVEFYAPCQDNPH